MTFEEIIMAAVEAVSGVKAKPHPLYRERVFLWSWGEVDLAIYFTNFEYPQSGEFYWGGGFLFTTSNTDLLDPSWSPTKLVEKINDSIIGIKNGF